MATINNQAWPDMVGLDGDFFGDAWTLITDSQDVDSTMWHLGYAVTRLAQDEGIGALFVLVGDGEYDAVYGIVGSIAYTHKIAYRLYPDCVLA